MKITSSTEFGKLIRARRIALDIAQGDLASMTGVDQGNLSKIERGVSKATLDTFLRLTSALGIDITAEHRT
jgi:transcriptional regulator with XRE-family HTH domain